MIFPLLVRQDFPKKSVLTEKVGKISPTHPRRFALQSGPPFFGLGAGNRGAIRGFSSLFEASPEKLESRFPGILISGKISIVEDFRVSHFVLGFLDPRSKFPQPRTTKGFDSVRVGTRITTNDDESQESFSNSSNESVFFRSEKAEDF